MKPLLLILCLAISAVAQTKDPLWNWSDGAIIGGMVVDEVSTRYALDHCSTCYESGVFKHTGARVGVKVGLFAAFKLWEWKRPEDRGKLKWVKLGVGLVFTGIAARNLKQ